MGFQFFCVNISFSLIRTHEEIRTEAVLDHQAFQADPLASVHQHVLSTKIEMDEKIHTEKGWKEDKGKQEILTVEETNSLLYYGAE